MSGLKLRPYQLKGINDVYAAFVEGYKRVIFWLATGGGKTFTFCHIVKETFESGGYVIICVKRRDLINQASKNLTEWGIPHGVHMSNHRRYRPKERVQICSIDTLDARALYPHADKCPLIIIDEAHDVRPTGKKYVRFLDTYPDSPVIGFTATPFGNNSLFDHIVKPIEPHELMEQGNLVPVKIFTPNQIDVSQVEIKRNGDFNEKQLFEASADSKVVGDFVRDWQLYSEGRPTVLFAVNVEHAEIIAKAFNEAGISAASASAKTKTKDRDRLLKDLKDGKLKVLCNVNIFSTGVDLPEISCIQNCRPTQSLIWYLQAIGRGLRPAPWSGKVDCRIIDNAGNTFRFGNPYRVHAADLSGKKRSDADDLEDISIRQCKRCHFVFEPTVNICPECNYTNPPVDRKIKHEDGELVEYNLSPEERDMMDRGLIIADCMKLKHVAKKRSFKKDWIFWKLKDKYGVDKMEKHSIIIFDALEDYPQ